MKKEEKKQEMSFIEEVMRRNTQLEKEGKLPMPTELFTPSISAEVLRRLKEKSKSWE